MATATARGESWQFTGKVWAVLWRAHTDTRSVAQFIDTIERVDHHKARIELANERLDEVLDYAQIHLCIHGQAVGVGKAAAQAATHQTIEREGRFTQIVGAADPVAELDSFDFIR